MDEDLDDLLNDALSDFDKPSESDKAVSREANRATVPADSHPKVSDTETSSVTVGASGNSSIKPPSELFDQFFDKDTSQSLQREWESAMQELVEDDPDLATHLKKLSKTLDTAAEASVTSSSTSPERSDHTEPPEALDLNKIMGETISGIGQSADELKNMTSSEAEEKLMRELKNMNLGGDMSDLMGQMGSMGGMEGDFMSMMEGMMQNLLSKDVLYPTMKEISKAYPEWLDENKDALPKVEYQRYEKQNEIINKICNSFEEESEDDTKEVKGQRLNFMMDLVEQMQQCGNPPNELLEKCGGGGTVDMGKFFGAAGSNFNPSNMFKDGDMQPPDGCLVM